MTKLNILFLSYQHIRPKYYLASKLNWTLWHSSLWNTVSYFGILLSRVLMEHKENINNVYPPRLWLEGISKASTEYLSAKILRFGIVYTSGWAFQIYIYEEGLFYFC